MFCHVLAGLLDIVDVGEEGRQVDVQSVPEPQEGLRHVVEPGWHAEGP